MLKVLERYSSLILTALLVVILLLYLDGCNSNRLNLKRISALSSYRHTVDQYQAKDGTVVNYNNSIAVTPDDLAVVQDTLLSYIKNLELKIKNVESSTIITERLILDTLEIPVNLTDCSFDTTVQVNEPNYNMDITMTNEGLTFNKLEFPNRVGVTLSERREKWFKPKQSIVAVTNSNPHMQIDGVSTYTFPKQKKWYNTWWAHAAEGVIVGSVATYLIVK